MTHHVHLITEQDLHAYVDGELTRERRAAVEAFLADKGLSARAAVSYLRQGFDLRGARGAIYGRDPSLRSEIEALLAKRRAGQTASFRGVGYA